MPRSVRTEVPQAMPPRKASREIERARTKTDTGGQVENTKVIGRTLVKELGKMAPQLREKGRPGKVTFLRGMEPEGAAVKRPKRLFTKNTGLCEVVRRRIGADACPVPEGHEERLAFGRSLESKPR